MKRMLSAGLLVAVLALALTAAETQARAWLGVSIQTVDEDLAEAFDLAADKGAIVNQVYEDSPADEAGIKEDDIIVRVGKVRITDEDDLIEAVEDAEPGDEVVLSLVRGGDEKELTVILADRKDRRGDPDMYFWSDKRGPGVYRWHYGSDDCEETGYIGVELLEISAELAGNLGAEAGGALINRVEEDSPAEKAGLKAGDVIISVDGESVREPGDVRESVEEFDEGETARIDIVRDKKRSTVEVEVATRENRFYGVVRSFPPIMKGLKLDDLGLDFDFDFDVQGFDDLDKLDLKAYRLDRDDLDDEMDELRRELEDLKKELKELKK
jgi:membrane-associated protease RseP (regulator of RpoE activity)